jgi:serine/threonine-protein kinase
VEIRKLGKYDIQERLGRGGMAEVYKGYHASLDRHVAIKILHSFLADDPEFKNRFEREARNVAKLKHPNIVQVYDFDYDEPTDRFYMVMELVEGPTLKDRLLTLTDQGQLLPLKESLRIVREAAGALAYAHSRNMLHRDVKPANLMLDRDSRVVLTDFGIAKIVTGVQLTQSGGMVGTPAYMAPEQGLGEPGDERSDLYSLGVILYQLVTGQLPYDAETPLAIILKHLNTPTPSARAVNAALPASVDRVISRAIAKEADDRYQSANEFIEDLTLAERGEMPVRRRAAPLLQTGSLDTVKVPPLADEPTEHLPAAARQSPKTPPKPQIAVVRRRRWRPLLLISAVLVLFASGLVGLVIGAGLLAPVIAPPTDGTALVSLAGDITDEPPTPVSISTETADASPTSSATAAPTNTLRPTQIPTATPSPTLTRTLPPSRTPTATWTPTITLTPSPSFTPSPDVTQTLGALTQIALDQAATAEACRYDYAIIEQNPADGGFFAANRTYTRKLLLLNTGTCDWAPNTSMTFVEGEDFDAGPRIWIRQAVPVGVQYELTFTGITPTVGGLAVGTWELRTPDQKRIGQPITISVSVFEGG